MGHAPKHIIQPYTIIAQTFTTVNPKKFTHHLYLYLLYSTIKRLIFIFLHQAPKHIIQPYTIIAKTFTTVNQIFTTGHLAQVVFLSGLGDPWPVRSALLMYNLPSLSTLSIKFACVCFAKKKNPKVNGFYIYISYTITAQTFTTANPN